MKLVLYLFSALITISACAQKKRTVEAKLSQKELSGYSQATFAAGCFWHEEALFESVKGVKEAISGYAGGGTSNPTYETVETGNTGHAETVNVYYDSKEVSYETLLKVYFAGQDPTQQNGQGNDLGTQYRSLVFYRNPAEKTAIENYIKNMTASGKYNKPIAAQVMPFTKFWQAEDYHQDFILHNPDQGYVQYVSIPEIKKVQKEFPELIKPGQFY